MRIFTIGHGARPAEELLTCLTEAGVRTLVDVRRFPGSKRHPQFNRDALERTLEDAGIAYRHADALGGRRSGGAEFTCIRVAAFRGYAAWMRNDEFAAGLASALTETEPCFMCAERLASNTQGSIPLPVSPLARSAPPLRQVCVALRPVWAAATRSTSWVSVQDE